MLNFLSSLVTRELFVFRRLDKHRKDVQREIRRKDLSPQNQYGIYSGQILYFKRLYGANLLIRYTT